MLVAQHCVAIVRQQRTKARRVKHHSKICGRTERSGPSQTTQAGYYNHNCADLPPDGMGSPRWSFPSLGRRAGLVQEFMALTRYLQWPSGMNSPSYTTYASGLSDCGRRLQSEGPLSCYQSSCVGRWRRLPRRLTYWQCLHTHI